MAFQSVHGMRFPDYQFVPINQVLNTTTNIDATGEKVAFVGPVWTPTRGSKSIRKVGFLFGAVTKAGGSALTLSLQNLSTSGPPWRPDETQDQTFAIANANAGFAPVGWLLSDNLSADRSVSYGEMLAVVIEYDGSGRLGADTFNLACFIGSQPAQGMCGLINKIGGAWSLQSDRYPICLLEFSDGTFGTIGNLLPISGELGASGVTTATNPDEVAMEFQVPFACKVEGAMIEVSLAGSTSDFQVVLYDSASSVLTSATIDANQLPAVQYNQYNVYFGAEVQLSANTTYRLALKPTTANSVSYNAFNVAAAGHLDAWPGGQAVKFAHRVDAGAWTTTSTRRVLWSLLLSAIDTGAAPSAGFSRLQLGH